MIDALSGLPISIELYGEPYRATYSENPTCNVRIERVRGGHVAYRFALPADAREWIDKHRPTKPEGPIA